MEPPVSRVRLGVVSFPMRDDFLREKEREVKSQGGSAQLVFK